MACNFLPPTQAQTVFFFLLFSITLSDTTILHLCAYYRLSLSCESSTQNKSLLSKILPEACYYTLSPCVPVCHNENKVCYFPGSVDLPGFLFVQFPFVCSSAQLLTLKFFPCYLSGHDQNFQPAAKLLLMILVGGILPVSEYFSLGPREIAPTGSDHRSQP